jgi:hypothetical protein
MEKADMAIDTTEIRVGQSGAVYVAPIGTAMPIEPDDVLDVAFVDLGAITEDGVSLEPGMTVEKLRAWQANKTVRVVKTEDELMASFTLMQWNNETVPLALGGGTISATPGAQVKYVPPAAGVIDERIFLIEWVDGANDYRLLIPRGMVTDVGEIQLAKTDAAGLELTVEVLGSAPADFIILTNDPAWS